MILVSVVTVVVTAVSVLLFVHSYRGALVEVFDERSAAYATAFADSAFTWLKSGDEEMLKAAASFLLLGSVLYVQVISDGSILVDDRAHAASALDLSPLLDGATTRRLARHRLNDGRRYVDIVLPQIPGSVQGERSNGYVRMGIDASSIGVRVYRMVLIASGIGTGFDGVVLGLLWLLLLHVRRERVSQAIDSGMRERSERILQIGDLVIDESAKTVSLNGKSVRLTPKQYALLSLLCSDPGRVFSESEILQAVWAESDYANSKDVKQYIYLLRRRLAGASSSGATLVVNIPGFGYKIENPRLEEDLTVR